MYINNINFTLGSIPKKIDYCNLKRFLILIFLKKKSVSLIIPMSMMFHMYQAQKHDCCHNSPIRPNKNFQI